MHLTSLEVLFQNYLKTADPEIEKVIVQGNIADNKRILAKERLAIYFNAYRTRLFETLIDDYPKLQRIMGKEAFAVLCLEYLNQQPSRYFSLRYFGQHLTAFLAKNKPYCEQSYLQEMAAFEWALVCSLDAADAPSLSIETSLATMRNLAPDHFAVLQFNFHPSVQLLYFNWNIPVLWKTIENRQDDLENMTDDLPSTSDLLPTSDLTSDLLPTSDLTSDLLPTFDLTSDLVSSSNFLSTSSTSVPWLIFRSNLSCSFRSMSLDEAFALQQAQSSATMASICEALCGRMEEERIPVFILQCIEQWLRDGIVTDIGVGIGI